MDDLLYDIGLSFESGKELPNKRHFFRNPYFIFTFASILLFQKLFVFTTDDEFTLLAICGDVTHYFLSMKLVMNVCMCLVFSLILCSQLIYYYNYRCGVKPTFLRVFKMIEGTIDGKELGFSSHIQLKSLRKTSKYLRFIWKYNKLVYPPFISIYNFASLSFTNYSLLEIIIYGTPPTLTLYYMALQLNNILITQFMYFYILCQYFRMKCKNLCKSIEQMRCGIRFLKINEILQSFDALYREISEYNDTYWSKFLFCFWGTFGTAIINLLMTVFLAEIPTLVAIVNFYCMIFISFQFLVIVLSAASVNRMEYKCYQTCNSLFVSQINYKTRLSKIMRARPKFKVKITCSNLIIIIMQ